MHNRKRLAAIGVAGACVLAGAAAGISQSAASSSSSKSRLPGAHAAGFGHGLPGRPGFGGEVHAEEVVLNKAGSAYITVTEDSGTITAVDAAAGKITLKEGTSTVTYATPTISVPSGATVLLDGSSSSLEKLASGDHVSISSSSEGTTVFATDSSFKPGAGPGPGAMGGAPPQGPPQQGALPQGQSY